MGQLTDDQWSVIYVATVSTAAFSMLCAIVTIIAYFRLKNYHNAVSGPACCMACAELVSMSAYCVGRFGPLAGDTSSLCQWQAVFEQIGDLSSILWTGCIALDLLLIMFFGYSVAQVRRLHFRVYAPICIILPLLISLVPLHVYSVTGTPFYGSSGLWCWIAESRPFYQLLLFYLPLWSIFLFNTITYLVVGRHIWKHFTSSGTTAASDEKERYKYTYLKNVSFYLLIFALAWTPPSINRLYRVFHPDNQVFVLYFLHATMPTANGIFNGFVYFYIAWISGVLSPGHIRNIDTRSYSSNRIHRTTSNPVDPYGNPLSHRLPTGNTSFLLSMKEHTPYNMDNYEITSTSSISSHNNNNNNNNSNNNNSDNVSSQPTPFAITIDPYPPHFPFS